MKDAGRSFYLPIANHLRLLVFIGSVKYVAYDDGRARLAIFDAPSFVKLPAVRRKLDGPAHFPALWTLFIGDKLSAVPVCGDFLYGLVFRFLNLSAIREENHL